MAMTFFEELTRSSHHPYCDGEAIYQIELFRLGFISLKADLPKERQKLSLEERKEIIPRLLSTEDLISDAFHVEIQEGDHNVNYNENPIIEYSEFIDYNEKTIIKYLKSTDYNISKDLHCIKHIKLKDIFNKVASSAEVNPNSLQYKLSIKSSWTDLIINLSVGPYNYVSKFNMVKKLYSINQIKLTVNEIFDEWRIFFESYSKIKKINEYLDFCIDYLRIFDINKYNLKQFFTFYNNFDYDHIQYNISNIDEDNLNRLLTLSKKVKGICDLEKTNKFNFSLKGIKFSYNPTVQKQIIFEIPLFNPYPLDSQAIQLLYGYLTSIDEFDNLIYKFERMYLSSL
jgi:hypothetical protein